MDERPISSGRSKSIQRTKFVPQEVFGDRDFAHLAAIGLKDSNLDLNALPRRRGGRRAFNLGQVVDAAVPVIVEAVCKAVYDAIGILVDAVVIVAERARIVNRPQAARSCLAGRGLAQ